MQSRKMNMLAAGAAALIAVGSSAVSAAPQSADAQFKALYTREWNWRVQQMLAHDGRDKAVPDHLPHVDARTQAMRLAYWQDVMKQLDAIPYDQLSPKQQVNYDVYKPQIAVLIADQKFKRYQIPINSDTNFWSGLTGTHREPFHTEQDYENWIAQLRDVPRYFREEADNMRAGEARGFDQPKVTMVGREDSLATEANAKPEDTGMYSAFKTMPSTIPADEQAKLRAEAITVIRTIAQPAFAKLYDYLHNDYIPHTRTTIAAYDLPDGKAYYQSQIEEFTTTDMTPAQIHQLGLQQTAILHQQMLDIMHQVGFEGSFADFQHYLRTDPKFYPKTALGYLKDAAWIDKEVDGRVSQYIGHMPRSRFAIIPVPAAIAPYYTSGRGGPGVYLVNTYDLSHRPLYNLTAMTLHESEPGHATQIPIAEEDRSLPDFRRYTYISAYGEGWALYCEWLGQEMGMYKAPLTPAYPAIYNQLGMLGWQAWRTSRLVVDTGIHAQGWTRAQAIKYLHDNTLLPDHEIQTEVDRYIAWPGQALSYYIGEMDIRKNRDKAQKALGAKFNIRAFHDAVLALGSVPLPVLDKHIDQFIAGGGIGPYPDEEQ